MGQRHRKYLDEVEDEFDGCDTKSGIKIKATWSFSLDVDCPSCQISLNLDSINGYSYVSDLELHICEQNTENSENIEVFCHHCNHKFLVDCQY